jgi:Flp pilus assembly secretin CpaC
MPLISFDPEYPVIGAVTNLAQQAGISFSIDPDLITNGVPTTVLTQPVGPVRFENVTARKALESLLARKGLMLGTEPGGSNIILAAKGAKLAPIEPEGGDLAKVAPDEALELQTFFDPNKEVPLITAVQMLARLAKLNILVDPRIKTGGIRQVGTNIVELPPVGTNTVSLSTYGGVTARQTLEAVLNNYGLIMVTDPNTGFSQITFRDPTAKEPVYTYTVPLRYSSTTNIQALVQVTFPTARVQSDARTAQLVLLATQREYEAITNLVAQLDTPTKQVLIEARFLETLSNPKSMKGVDWQNTLQGQRVTMGNGTLAGSRTTTTTSPGDTLTVTRPDGTSVQVPQGSSTTVTDTKTETLSSQALSLSSAGGFTPNVAFLNAQGVDAVLSFLNTEAESRTIATPRAVTLDNQETRLEVTEAIPIFNATEAIGQAGTAVSSSRPDYTNVGTILIVTPRITGSNVAMKVKPEISKVARTAERVVQGKVNQADVFASSRIETQVLVPSGNTLVMGGLISDSTQKNYTKVPFLGDIPGIGWAFRKETKESQKANLIIFLTPTIIENEDFQPHRTEFLNTVMPEHPSEKPEYWNRGKPYSKVKEESDTSTGIAGNASETVRQ